MLLMAGGEGWGDAHYNGGKLRYLPGYSNVNLSLKKVKRRLDLCVLKYLYH